LSLCKPTQSDRFSECRKPTPPKRLLNRKIRCFTEGFASWYARGCKWQELPQLVMSRCAIRGRRPKVRKGCKLLESISHVNPQTVTESYTLLGRPRPEVVVFAKQSQPPSDHLQGLPRRLGPQLRRLPALKPVQGLVEISLYGGLVARELGKGVCAVRVQMRARSSADASWLLISLWPLRGEYPGLHVPQAPEPPEKGGDALHKSGLQLNYWLQLGPSDVRRGLSGAPRPPREDILREEPVLGRSS
jgi:hypothetical protein